MHDEAGDEKFHPDLHVLSLISDLNGKISFSPHPQLRTGIGWPTSSLPLGMWDWEQHIPKNGSEVEHYWL